MTFDVQDLKTDDGDASGSLPQGAAERHAGVSYSFGTGHALPQHRVRLRDPDHHRAGNRPDGAGGFNARSSPQRTLSAELGARGADHRLVYLLGVGVREPGEGCHRAVPRRRRAGVLHQRGQDREHGFELGLTAAPIPQFSANVSFTYANYTFTDYVVLNGTSPTRSTATACPACRDSSPASGFVAARLRLRGGPRPDALSSLTADDQNSIWVENWGAGVTNLRVSWSKQWRTSRSCPYVGLANLFDRKYIGRRDRQRLRRPRARAVGAAAELLHRGGDRLQDAELEQRHRVTVDRHPHLARPAAAGARRSAPPGRCRATDP